MLELDADRNTVVVGGREELDAPGLETGSMNWLMSAPPEAGERVEVQIRAHHAPASASVHPRADGTAELYFDHPQAAVTPGQLAVLYRGDRVLGGGPISRAITADQDSRIDRAGSRSATAGGRATP